MFEKLCALLVRLYPAEFRRAYGGEAVQLIVDRARHERSCLLRLRLLMDLAIDLGTTSLHSWAPGQPLRARIDGAPRFEVITAHGPRSEALGAGMLISALLFAGFTLLFDSTAPTVNPAVGKGHKSDVPAAAVASGDDPLAQATATNSQARHRLIADIADNLTQHYFERAVGTRVAEALSARDKNGEYESIGTDANLATRLNGDIQTAARTLGIPPGVFVADVVYSVQPLPKGPPPPIGADVAARNRAAMLRQNCLFETIEKLPRNVGYLKLNGFAEAAVCHDTTARAMASLNTAAALVLDLRDNGGGMGETALQLAGYLFDRPTYMYDPRAGSSVPATTASPVPGNALADKPVYVLTSSTTQSAAEYLVYNLKMLKRATVVGETTAGHQHSGAFYRIDDHFGIGIQDARPRDNPYAVKGWEVIGIEPDVKVPRTQALDTAKRLIESRTRGR